MSTFGGKFEELPGISVDRFDRHNAKSRAYFLSHCHQDHMVGLLGGEKRCEEFWEHISESADVYLYGSAITVRILSETFGLPKSMLKELTTSGPTIIPMDGKALSVTTVPAGHCPGSVMFLFELENVTVLYSGDYRINPSDLNKFRAFYDSFGELKRIDSLYLDTTFFNPDYETLPDRNSIMNELAGILKRWLGENPTNLVKIICPATYGSENFFTELSKHLQMPVHVSESKYKFYKSIPEMDSAVTLDGNATRLHASCGTNYKHICKEGSLDKVKVLRPSALTWTKDFIQRANGSWIIDEGNAIKVCYSCHASFEEGRAFVDFLKPLRIHECVEPTDERHSRKMKEVLTKYRKRESGKFNSGIFIGNIETRCTNVKEMAGEISNLLNSPPRKRKIFKK